MASETHVEEEIDMIVLHIKTKQQNWLAQDNPLASLVAGELEDLAEEIVTGQHWHRD